MESLFLSECERHQLYERVANTVIDCMYKQLVARSDFRRGDPFICIIHFTHPCKELLDATHAYVCRQIELEKCKLFVDLNQKEIAFLDDMIEPSWFSSNVTQMLWEVRTPPCCSLDGRAAYVCFVFVCAGSATFQVSQENDFETIAAHSSRHAVLRGVMMRFILLLWPFLRRVPF